MSHQRTVYVIDQDLETRRSLTIHLATIGAEAWPFASGDEFLEIISHLMPGCILLDVDGEEQLGVLRGLRERELGWPVVAMSLNPNVTVAVEAMKLGCLDFLEKPVGGPQLAAALTPAWTSLEASLASCEARRDAQEKLGRLTARELDISIALFGGLSNKVVAHDFGISVRTVEMHRAHIMAKLGVRSIAEAAVMATHAGLAFASASAETRRAVVRPAPARIAHTAFSLRSPLRTAV
jgi:FixJ family two-component response regulator